MVWSVKKKRLPFLRKIGSEEKKERWTRKAILRRGKKWSRALRGRATPPELACQEALIFLGIEFEFQKPVPFLVSPRLRIVDFFLPDSLTVIEIDGPSHLQPKGVRDDEKRTAQFADEYPHFKLLRFTNAQAMRADFSDIIRRALGLPAMETWVDLDNFEPDNISDGSDSTSSAAKGDQHEPVHGRRRRPLV